MLQELDHSDWEEVFAYASGENTGYGCGEGTPEAAFPGCQTSTKPFGREDVKRILAMDEGVNDEEDWVGVFELKDGRFASVAAWCDYTGWD